MKEPKPTCPLINNLRNELTNDINDPDRLTYLHSCLEEIREANASLREWGHHWKKEVDTLTEQHP